ncbi:hypothetical protein PR048_004785 [Dryococelus australis]|uniref:Uncharacterized protein n=1 Tax=Dryococelus australis TaxID=614101 RepID=A0ABQ9I6E7_9NEOP|nr:hypothetical protein PR048_004785 [Dryococelus australis]
MALLEKFHRLRGWGECFRDCHCDKNIKYMPRKIYKIFGKHGSLQLRVNRPYINLLPEFWMKKLA